MSFASVLDAYCNATGCTNKEIAATCGLSPSALSRYRNGERVPDLDGDAIDRLVAGVISMARERGADRVWQEDIVRSAFEASLSQSKPANENFSSRLNTVMTVLGMRNTEVANALGVSPSYVSRIRNGQRMASGRRSMAESFAHVSAQRCIELGKTDELMGVIDPSGEELRESYFDVENPEDLAEAIERWLFGNKILESEVRVLEGFLDKLDKFYFEQELESLRAIEPIKCSTSDFEQKAEFYYGTERMKQAEAAFFEMSAQRESCEVCLSSDMPLLESSLAPNFAANYRLRIGSLIKRNAQIKVIHNLDRTLAETVLALEMWLPLYLTGHVKPYYLKGMSSKLFSHVNYVSDVCALAAEAVIGHEAEGRYYLTTVREDIIYYRRKMKYIMEHVSSMLEIYCDYDRDQRVRFKKLETERHKNSNGRVIGADRYDNLFIVSYPGDCTVVNVLCDSPIHLVIRHPKVRYIASRMK